MGTALKLLLVAFLTQKSHGGWMVHREFHGDIVWGYHKL
jgi:hypothetical protein